MIVDIVFQSDNSCDFIIKSSQNTVTEIIFHISSPLKYGVDIWKQIRNSKIGCTHYDGSKMTERTGYNIKVLFNEKLGTSQHIQCYDGILEFAIELDRGEKKRYSLLSIKVPLESCYNAIDKIIEYYKK
jgi:hypothetical protein